MRWLLLGAIPLAAGGYLGLSYSSQSRISGFNAAFAVVALYILGLLILMALLIGGVNLLRREGRGRRTARVAFAAAALLAVGGVGGYAADRLLGGAEPVGGPEPSVRPTLAATVTLRLEQDDWVASDASGTGICPFAADGGVRLVTAERAGDLQEGPMSVTLQLDGRQLPDAVVPLTLVVETLGEDFVTWSGMATLDEIHPESTNGLASFVDLPMTKEPLTGWPVSLSGSLRWTCN